MFLDIHRHSSDNGNADKVLRNLFHNESEQLQLSDICSFGLHPWHVNSDSLDSDIEQVRNASKNNKVLAIGEAGIDKLRDANLETQRKAFTKQIEIAKETNKAMIIHCVRAYDELQQFRKTSNHKNPWIIHWFNASIQTGLDLIKKDCFLSFGHMLFKDTSKAYKTFLEVPLEFVFLETDDANITIDEVYRKAAKLKRISVSELQEQIKSNFFRCFGIEL